MREIITDEYDIKRFKPNMVIRYLKTKISLNDLWGLYNEGFFSEEEMKEFYQLIGYPISGYEEIFDAE
jgi:hypothetical protein